MRVHVPDPKIKIFANIVSHVHPQFLCEILEVLQDVKYFGYFTPDMRVRMPVSVDEMDSAIY